jgi:hypothetical protein
MAVDEESRLGLYEALKEVIGVDHATTFMEHLPYGGWQRLADKDDVARLEREIARLRAATKDDIAQLEAATKNDVTQLEAATKNDITRLETTMQREIAALEERLELRFETKLHKEISALHRSLFIGLGTLQAAFAGVIIALG